MTKKEKRLIGQIFYLASDERMRVLKVDHLDWLEKKMIEIKRLTEKLPYILYDSKVGPV